MFFFLCCFHLLALPMCVSLMNDLMTECVRQNACHDEMYFVCCVWCALFCVFLCQKTCIVPSIKVHHHCNRFFFHFIAAALRNWIYRRQALRTASVCIFGVNSYFDYITMYRFPFELIWTVLSWTNEWDVILMWYVCVRAKFSHIRRFNGDCDCDVRVLQTINVLSN